MGNFIPNRSFTSVAQKGLVATAVKVNIDVSAAVDVVYMKTRSVIKKLH